MKTLCFEPVEPIEGLIDKLKKGNKAALARCITLIENEGEGYEQILLSIDALKKSPVIGVTGPPGAGKSTLINALVTHLSAKDLKIGIIAVDPSSPFSLGSLLGDRIRMSGHFTNENIFIRSLAARGHLGGLSAKTVEIIDVMSASDFDYIIVETVGVGQSEIEIAGLADVTVLLLVPEGGDDVQTLKSGIMEIADIYVVNKADRPGASVLLKNLHELLHDQNLTKQSHVVKTIAAKNEGINELVNSIEEHIKKHAKTKRAHLLAEKAYFLICSYRMKDIKKEQLRIKIEDLLKTDVFNLYRFIKQFIYNNKKYN